MCDDDRSVKTVSHPTGTRRNNVITTSNRRRFDVIMTLFLRRVSAGTSIHLPRCSVLFFGFRETAGGSGPADVEQPIWFPGNCLALVSPQSNLSSCRKHREKTIATKVSESWHSYSQILNSIYYVFDWKWDSYLNISTITHETNTRSWLG